MRHRPLHSCIHISQLTRRKSAGRARLQYARVPKLLLIIHSND